MLKARNPFTPILFVTLNLPTSDEHAMEIEDHLVQDLNSIGCLQDAAMFAPEMLIPAQSPQVSHTALACQCHHWLCHVTVTTGLCHRLHICFKLHCTVYWNV